MSDELKECPFCPDGGDPEIMADDFNGFTPWCAECGTEMVSCITREEAVSKWNIRYKRTCRKVPGRMGYQGRKQICSECGYGLGDSRWCFCPKCGAEICGAEVVDG